MKRISYQKMARIYRAINGEWDSFPEITTDDVIDLDVEGETFWQFVERNRDRVEYYDEERPVIFRPIRQVAAVNNN